MGYSPWCCKESDTTEQPSTISIHTKQSMAPATGPPLSNAIASTGYRLPSLFMSLQSSWSTFTRAELFLYMSETHAL